ncbi:type VI secretion system lipoprotein TssJ [Vibrio sp. ZSDE26]|uniref:Type VI secretion system lipoprotein TssJ n=2 Tax=Vibrio amylolyticus TaxID=2847292 RepID=A0A9X1XKV9_9VIBR|nr:type VI secretion system lipoprotein TssJ [Vibrio amylolyticus]MCK6265152.1 type VI secretion system lipoprotein TssJ [Vibrio amylolyticus]
MFMLGCSSDPVPTYTTHNFAVKADDTINPSATSKANPVVVRLYQLNEKQVFLQAPFIELYTQDEQVLSSSLISKQVLSIVMPNSSNIIDIDINKNTLFLAVLVEYANYQQSEPKVVSVLPSEEEQYLQLNLTGNKAEFEVITPDTGWW